MSVLWRCSERSTMVSVPTSSTFSTDCADARVEEGHEDQGRLMAEKRFMDPMRKVKLENIKHTLS